MRLLDIQLLIANPLLDQGEHRHPFHELIAPVRGPYSARVADRELHARPGELVLYPAGARHRPTFARTHQVSFMLLQWYEDDGPVREPTVLADPGNHLIAALQWLWSTRQMADPPKELRRSLLRAIRAQLALNLETAEERERTTPPVDQATLDPIDRVVNFLHGNFTKPFTLDQLAGIAGMPRSTFTRRFRQALGATPGQIVTTFRCNHACHLLLRYQGDAESAGREAGFGSASNFRRAFRAFHGCTPRQWYRRRIPGGG